MMHMLTSVVVFFSFFEAFSRGFATSSLTLSAQRLAITCCCTCVVPLKMQTLKEHSIIV